MSVGERIFVNTGGIGAIVIMALALLAGCEEIHDPWVTGNNYFEEERQRPPEQQKALRDRALYQAGPGGGEGENHELSRFIEK